MIFTVLCANKESCNHVKSLMSDYEVSDYKGYNYDHIGKKEVESFAEAREHCKKLKSKAKSHIVDIDFHINYS